MEEQDSESCRRPSFSFAGCGFIGVYHIGVMGCLQKYVPHLLKNAEFAGASAGAMIASCFLCEIPIEKCVDSLLHLVTQAHKYTLRAFDPSFPINDILHKLLDDALPVNAHELCSGRLHISVTKLMNLNFLDLSNMRRNEIISEFPTRKALIQAILCSSYIPVFSDSKNPILADEITIDGAFSNNLPKLREDTILISPFAGDQHICPRDDGMSLGLTTMFNMSINMSMENAWRLMDAFFIPSAIDLKEYCRRGYDDTLRFLTESGLISCSAHSQTDPSSLPDLPSWMTDTDCEDCREHVKHAHNNKFVPENHKFDKVINHLGKEAKRNQGPDFTFTEVIKLLLMSPLEMARLASVAACMVTRSFVDVLQYMGHSLKHEMGVLNLLKSALTDEGQMLKTILFRTTTLSIMKTLAFLCRVMSYVGSCQLMNWLKAWCCRLIAHEKFQTAARSIKNNAIEGFDSALNAVVNTATAGSGLEDYITDQEDRRGG